MSPSKSQPSSVVAHRVLRRDRALIYGFVASVVGLPLGIALGLPVVWSLAALGIVIGGFKLALRQFAVR